MLEFLRIGGDDMPNDAKLGLLAGVLGVIVAAVVSVQQPNRETTTTPTPLPQEDVMSTAKAGPAASADKKGPPPSPAVLPADLAAKPVIRTRKEPDGTAASRNRNDDDIDP